MHSACAGGSEVIIHADILAAILEAVPQPDRNVFVNITNQKGYTALMTACETGYTAGAFDAFLSPIHIAALIHYAYFQPLFTFLVPFPPCCRDSSRWLTYDDSFLVLCVTRGQIFD